MHTRRCTSTCLVYLILPTAILFLFLSIIIHTFTTFTRKIAQVHALQQGVGDLFAKGFLDLSAMGRTVLCTGREIILPALPHTTRFFSILLFRLSEVVKSRRAGYYRLDGRIGHIGLRLHGYGHRFECAKRRCLASDWYLDAELGGQRGLVQAVIGKCSIACVPFICSI